MVTKTLRYPVFFGRTVSAEAKAVSYKTSCQIPDWGNAFEFSKIVSAGNQEVYKKKNSSLAHEGWFESINNHYMI